MKKKVGSLELANRSLIMQVQKLQALVAQNVKSIPSNKIRAEGRKNCLTLFKGSLNRNKSFRVLFPHLGNLSLLSFRIMS